jgi:putative zinc finger/helix-turn-helix YgiT family protein
MANLICAECKKGVLVKKTGDYETAYIDHDGKSRALTVPNVTWLECKDCSEVILDDQSMSTIEAGQRKARGLLTPQEIRALRERLDKTQKGMSELLGIGEKTYCRWESGSYIQSEAFDRYMRLLISNESNVYALQEIADGRHAAEPTMALDELRKTFRSIKDIQSVAERSRRFVPMFSEGTLQAVA